MSNLTWDFCLIKNYGVNDLAKRGKLKLNQKQFQSENNNYKKGATHEKQIDDSK